MVQRTYSTRFDDYALEFYSFSRQLRPVYSRPIECTDRAAPFLLDGVLYHESDLDSMSTTRRPSATPKIDFAAFGMVALLPA